LIEVIKIGAVQASSYFFLQIADVVYITAGGSDVKACYLGIIKTGAGALLTFLILVTSLYTSDYIAFIHKE
jgi:hypothetical protein